MGKSIALPWRRSITPADFIDARMTLPRGASLLPSKATFIDLDSVDARLRRLNRPKTRGRVRTADPARCSEIDLLGQLQCVVNFDA